MFKFCGSLFSDLLNKALRSLPAWILWFRGSGRVAKAVRPGQDSRPSFTSSTWCRRNISKTMFSSFLQVLSVQSPRKVDHIKILLEMRELLSQLIVTKIYPKKRGRPVWPCYYSLERSVVERSVAASCFRDERRETWPCRGTAVPAGRRSDVPALWMSLVAHTCVYRLCALPGAIWVCGGFLVVRGLASGCVFVVVGVVFPFHYKLPYYLIGRLRVAYISNELVAW